MMIDDKEAAVGFCNDVCKYEVGMSLYKSFAWTVGRK